MPFTEYELAKYPFLPQAARYIRQLDLKIEDLTESLQEVLKHAEQRIIESFITPPPTFKDLHSRSSLNPHVEIPSFPVAIMMVSVINDKYLKKRYALYEAKKSYENLKLERDEKILEVACYFNWNIQMEETKDAKTFQTFKLFFTSYIQNAATLQQPEWKLVNRTLTKGRVHLTKREACRLLQEEIRRHVEARLGAKIDSTTPEIRGRVETLKNMFTARKGAVKLEEYPQTVDFEAFPPCVKALYNSISSGHHLSHIGRFSLTTFLVNIGMTAENVIDLFRSLSDFNEHLTSYQVEHLAGERGSRVRYIPPRCSTLKTHGVCVNPDTLCERVRHPLSYYRWKIRTQKKV